MRTEVRTGTLLCVATPIGNLGDMSPRAIQSLQQADIIFCEDTRHSRPLLQHFGITAAPKSLHEHNERQKQDEILQCLASGKTVALLTDAGTPAISDPGAHIVKAALQSGYRVSPIPGASALSAALSACGLVEDAQTVSFLGFVPASGSKKQTFLERVLDDTNVTVVFETPHRISETLQFFSAREPSRQLCVCRELTKLHEEIKLGPAAALADYFSAQPRGEFVVVVAGRQQKQEHFPIDDPLKRCLSAGMSVRDASTAVAAIFEHKKKDVYQRCLELAKPAR